MAATGVAFSATASSAAIPVRLVYGLWNVWWLLLTGLHDQIVDCVDTGVAKFLISKEGA